MRAVLLVAVGGAIGAAARWGAGVLLPHDAGSFPWATLLVNLAGCAAIGWCTRTLRRSDLWLLVVTGGLGGFTTFSTFAVETRELLVDGRAGVAVAYMVVTLIAGITITRLAAGRRAGTDARSGAGTVA